MRRSRISSPFVLLLVIFFAAGNASAATFTVSNLNDSGDGSLRRAILNANANPGPDVIDFSVAGPILVLSQLPALSDISGGTTIDGTTVPGLVTLYGPGYASTIDGIQITSSNNSIVALQIVSFRYGISITGTAASGNSITGNQIGNDGYMAEPNGDGIYIENSSQNIIGGIGPTSGNVISGNNGSGIRIGTDCIDNVVQGNYIGTDVTGMLDLGNNEGISVSGSGNHINEVNLILNNTTGITLEGSGNSVHRDNFIGHNDTGILIHGSNNIIGWENEGNSISENGYGILVEGENATGNLIQNNHIEGNSQDGVAIRSNQTMVQGNVISGNEDGIAISGTAENVTVKGNNIKLNVGNGISISGGSSHVIGGTLPGEGNTISLNAQNGIRISFATACAIRGNSIFSNYELGIDLSPVGVNPNDAGDGDTGANELQNFPILTSANISDPFTTNPVIITGIINSTSNTTFELDFFSNSSAHPSGYGEGESYLGSTTVITDGSGNASFLEILPVEIFLDDFITATATDPNGNTSEFSAVVQPIINQPPNDIFLSNTNMDENSTIGNIIGILTAEDPDPGETFTFSEVNDPDNKFSIVGDELRVDGALDFETAASHQVTIRVTDSGNLTYDETFAITVNDVNEAPTDITLSKHNVDENSTVGTVIGALTGSDPDAGETLTFFELNDPDNKFAVVGDELRVDGALDFETVQGYGITIRVRDSGDLTYDKDFDITVNDVNEAPTDIALSKHDVDENSTVGTVIGTLTGSDPDAGETLTFFELNDPDNKFAIVGDELQVDGPLDFETAQGHDITIRVRDSGNLTYDKDFGITVNDVNEAPTDISLDNSNVAENESVSTLVGTFTTTDPEGGTFSYTLAAGTGDTDNGSFSISGDQLFTNAIFDFEIQNSFSIRVRSENGGGLSVEKNFTITATDVNETPTDIALSNDTVDENLPVGTVIGTLTGTDPDAGETLTFSEFSDPDNKFAVVGNKLQVDGTLDFETASSHQVTIRVTDSGNLTYDELFTINVNDINEAPTDIALDNSSVAENEPVGALVGTFNTTDPEGGSFTYALASGAGDTDNGSFSISSDQLLTNAVFDYETQNSFSIRVRSENGGGLFLEKNFIIDILNANDPTAANAGPDQTISCASSNGALVDLDGTGSTDPDGDPLAYTWRENGSIIAGPINDPITNVNLSVGFHTVELTVDDSQGGTDMDEVTITINVGTGSISGSVTLNGTGLAGVTVKILENADPNNIIDYQTTGTNGSYSFSEVPVNIYQIMIVEPLGYLVNQNFVVTDLACGANAAVDFSFTEIVLLNEARGKGYWKHQFDVYVTGRGNAQESEQGLMNYIAEVEARYNIHFDIFAGMTELSQWQTVLSVKGNAGMEAKATAKLAALLMNMVSLKLAQYEVVTVDGYTAGDVLTYVSVLIEDSDPFNDELAKDLAEQVNLQQTIGAGIVPVGGILYKGGQGLSSIEWGFGIPKEYALFQNYPNPFNPSTNIEFSLPHSEFVTLKVYSILGEEVATLVSKTLAAGKYKYDWDASRLASGVYLYRIQAGNYVESKKMILLR